MTASKVASKDSLFHCRFTAGDSIFFTPHTLVLVLVLVLSYQLWALLSLTPRGLAPPNQREKKGARAPISWLHLRGPEGQRAAGTTSASPQERPELSCRPPVGFVGRQKGAGNDGRGKEERRRRNALSRSRSLLSSQIKLSPSKLAKKANRKKQNRSGRALSPRAREREREKHRVRRVHRREDAPSR